MALRILPLNYFDDVTDLAVTPSAVSTLPITNLQTTDRADVWRSPNREPQVITGSWGGNVRQLSAWGIWPGLGAASLIGARIRLELFSTPTDMASGVAAVYDSGTLDFFAWSGTGWGDFAWGATPWGCEESDRTARIVPFVAYFAATPASSFRITISDSGALDSAYLEARRIWLADYVEAPLGPGTGAAPQWKSNSQQTRTTGGSLKRIKRARWRELRFETVFENESDRAAWSDLTYLADQATEIVLSPFAGDGTRLERDYTAMGSLDVMNPIVFQNPNFNQLQLSIVES